MSSRLERWRTSQALSAHLIGTLCGITADELVAIEQGAQCNEADEYALALLFGDVFGLPEILTFTTATDEREIMRRMTFHFAEQCRAWTK